MLTVLRKMLKHRYVRNDIVANMVNGAIENNAMYTLVNKNNKIEISFNGEIVYIAKDLVEARTWVKILNGRYSYQENRDKDYA